VTSAWYRSQPPPAAGPNNDGALLGYLNSNWNCPTGAALFTRVPFDSVDFGTLLNDGRFTLPAGRVVQIGASLSLGAQAPTYGAGLGLYRDNMFQAMVSGQVDAGQPAVDFSSIALTFAANRPGTWEVMLNHFSSQAVTVRGALGSQRN